MDNPTEADAEQKLSVVLRVKTDRKAMASPLYQHQPSPGQREVTLDSDRRFVASEKMTVCPTYEVTVYGWKEKQVALTV